MNRDITIFALFIGTIHAAGGVIGCSCTNHEYVDTESSMAEKTIEQVQEAYTDEWMAIPGVEGTAIGLSEDKPCIMVFSSVKAEQLRDKIPSNIEGYPVIIRETGQFRALDRH